MPSLSSLARRARPWILAAALVAILLAVVLVVAPSVPSAPFIYQRF